MDSLRNNIVIVKCLIAQSYQAASKLIAHLEKQGGEPPGIERRMEKMCSEMEKAVVEMRNLCEHEWPDSRTEFTKPFLTNMKIAGSAEVNRYGWLHIELQTLLPHCRFQTPKYLSDTVVQLLDSYEAEGHTVPRYEDAILIIDEHCDIFNRHVFDQDNKGWKAIPNALKGRVVRDDDQFTLELALLSTVSDKAACHITVLPKAEAGEFFMLRHDGLM